MIDVVTAGKTARRDRSGRVLGKTGAARREALLDALENAIRTAGWRRVSVPAMTREAGCSAAAFYQYFESVEAAFGEVFERAVVRAKDAGGDVPGHLEVIRELLEFERGLGRG